MRGEAGRRRNTLSPEKITCYKLPLHYVAFSIAHFVPFEVRSIYTPALFCFLTNFGHWPFIAMLRVEAIVYVPVELGWAMEPGSGANENAAGKPFRSVISRGSARIRSNVIVSIGTLRRHTDVNGDLGAAFGGDARPPIRQLRSIIQCKPIHSGVHLQLIEQLTC